MELVLLFSLHVVKIQADATSQLSTGNYRCSISHCSNASQYFIHIPDLRSLLLIYSAFLNSLNSSFVEEPQMTWFAAKEHCKGIGGDRLGRGEHGSG